MMYRDYFNLTDEPFRLAPDPNYLYVSRGHGRARAYLDYSLISREGFVVITGEIGSGKTLMLRHLLAELPADQRVVHIEQTQLTPVELLQRLYLELAGQIATTDNKIELLEYLRELLADAWAHETRVIIAVDEAQALGQDVLEEIRMLMGSEVDGERLFSVILLGQPELDRILDQPDMEQLRQRVRLRFHLGGLARDEVEGYIHRRLSVAGAAEPERLIGGSDTLDRIFEYTNGIPRLINTLCEMALLVACLDHKPGVDREVIDSAIAELRWQPWAARRDGPGRLPAAVPVALPAGEAGLHDERVASMQRIAATLEAIDMSLARIAHALDQKVVPLRSQRGSK